MKTLTNSLKKLLAIPSTSDNIDQLRVAVDFVEEMFNDTKVYIKQFSKNDKPSILITTQFTREPKVLMVGHVDVVPAEYDGAYEPYEEDGKLYGRGASDMKGTIMACVYAMISAIEENPDLDIGLMITADEEVGGFNGVKYLVEEENIKPEFVFVPDGGDNWNICTDEKGIWHIKVTVNGQAAHGSRPWLGVNSNRQAIEFYNFVESTFMTKWGDFYDKDNWLPTVNLGVINGGQNTNSVPSITTMNLDIRHPHEQTREEIQAILDEACEKYDAAYETIVYGYPSHTDEDDSQVVLWKEMIEAKGKTSEFTKSEGASDNRFFSAKGIPSLISKPTCAPAHVDHEWIDIKELEEYTEILTEWLKEVGS